MKLKWLKIQLASVRKSKRLDLITLLRLIFFGEQVNKYLKKLISLSSNNTTKPEKRSVGRVIPLAKNGPEQARATDQLQYYLQ